MPREARQMLTMSNALRVANGMFRRLETTKEAYQREANGQHIKRLNFYLPILVASVKMSFQTNKHRARDIVGLRQ